MSGTQYSRAIILRVDADDIGALTRVVMHGITILSAALASNGSDQALAFNPRNLKVELRRLRSLLDRLENAQ